MYRFILIFVVLNIYTGIYSKTLKSPKTIVTSLNRVSIKPIVVGDDFFMSKICGIYKITNPKGRIYIGQSIDIQKRKNRYKNNSCKTQTRLCRSILKYGFDKHKFEIIDYCDPKDLNEREAYYIDLYQCFENENGLNLRAGGGSNGGHSEESKKKLSDKKKIPVLCFTSKGDFYKEYLSCREAGQEFNCTGENISTACLNNSESKTAVNHFWIQKKSYDPKIHTKEFIISRFKKEFNIKVDVYDCFGKLIGTYDSISECARTLFPLTEVSSTSKISQCLKGKRRKHKGYTYKFNNPNQKNRGYSYKRIEKL